MAASLIYNSEPIIPAPLISISKTYTRSGGSEKVSPEYNIVLTGTILSYMGSPQSNGLFTSSPTDENLSEAEKNRSIRNKQDAIRKLFAQDGHTFQIQDADGFEILKCNPIINSIEFEGNGTEVWVDLCRYTIDMTATKVVAANTVLPDSDDDDDDLITTQYHIDDFSEEWSVEFNTLGFDTILNNYPSYNVTHTISATGRLFYQTDGTKVPAWESARDFCKSRMGFNSTRVTTDAALTIPSTGYTAYDYQRESSQDEYGGTYSVTESWIYTNVSSTYPCILTMTAEVSKNRRQNPINSLVVNGTIQGLDNSGGLIKTKQRYTNASNYLKNNILNDSEFSGTFPGLNTLFAFGILLFITNTYGTVTVSNFTNRLNFKSYTSIFRHDPENGNITFTFEFNDEPTNLIPNALSETINITDVRSARIVAKQPIVNRGLGPILQDMHTYTESTRSLDIELVMSVSSIELKTGVSRLNYIYLNSKPNTDSIVAQFIPSGDTIYTNNYRDGDTESYDIKTGQYRRSVTWTYQPCSLPTGQTVISPQY
jgi:hypothetical protein